MRNPWVYVPRNPATGRFIKEVLQKSAKAGILGLAIGAAIVGGIWLVTTIKGKK